MYLLGITKKEILKVLYKSIIYAKYPSILLYPILENKENQYHLKKAIHWLKNAQDSSLSAGIPAHFNLLSGKWGNPYRETTGYIIPTFIVYSKISKDKDLFERAKRMGDWEIEVQDEGGGIGEIRENGNVVLKIFNTGQVILGWCALYDETKEKKYLDAIIKASNWIVFNQFIDGSWQNFSNNGGKTFDSRVAWSLLEAYKRTNDHKYKIAAEKNLKWTLGMQTDNGWFKETSLGKINRPWTHLIAYTIGGIVDCAKILNDKNLIKEAQKPALEIANYFLALPKDKCLPCTFNPEWQSDDNYSCLTGNCQMAIIWRDLFLITGHENFLKASEKMISQMKGLQFLSGSKDIAGGLPGSFPIDGAYVKYGIPNWGVKFFADMLISIDNKNNNLLG